MSYPNFGTSAFAKPNLKLEQPTVTQFQQLALSNKSNSHFHGIKSVSSIRSTSTGPQRMLVMNKGGVLSSQGHNSKPSIDGVERSIERIFKELEQ